MRLATPIYLQLALCVCVAMEAGLQEKEEEEAREGEGEEREQKSAGKRSCASFLLEELFPALPPSRGQRRLTRSRSVAILSALYCSHAFSAWGDRMWQFLVTLLLALLYPGSLLLPAVFGLVFALLPALLGTVLGDFVDRNPRMRVVWVSLLVQNSLVCGCAVCLAFLFGRNLDICGDVPLYLFIILSIIVIILGASANLATVVNTIAIEKDWVVVIANKNECVLASLNANMRRIDLLCKLLAPAVAGVILQFAGPLTTTIVVASWNVVSFFAELGLVCLVYLWVPALATKKLRKGPANLANEDDAPLIEGEGGSGEGEVETGEGGDGENEEWTGKEEDIAVKEVKGRSALPSWCSGLLAPYVSLREGWAIYWHQEVALAGVAMATIYLTVLGFSGVTAAFFLTQNLPNAAIGAAQGIGAIFGVTGTIAYPIIRRRIGTVRTGMFGISSQLAMLMLCVVAVVIPGERIENSSEGYYSAHCLVRNDTTDSLCTDFPVTSSLAHTLPTPSPTLSHLTTSLITPSPTPEGSGSGDLRPIREAPAETGSDQHETNPTPSPTCSTKGSKVEWNAARLLPLILMLAGIILARFGLWIFDLSVQQRVQETVAEEMRGAVGGVMNAMNSVMDMMHYVLVIAAPRPEHFGILTLISVAMVTLGALLYAIYLRRVRGHLFHFRQCWSACQSRFSGRSRAGLRVQMQIESEVNENAL